VFFRDQYGMSKVSAGDFATIVVLCGSFLRPVGGSLADRIGGFRLLGAILFVAGASLLLIAALPSLPVALGLLALTMAMFGMGNGAVFQLVPQRFAGSVGIMTGLVGAAGGAGGFFLPSTFGVLKDTTQSYASGFLLFGSVVVAACAVLYVVLGRRWQRAWPEELLLRAGLASASRTAAVNVEA
jgi:NNP family nitrate/nitrite transporter-like MFS transporter